MSKKQILPVVKYSAGKSYGIIREDEFYLVLYELKNSKNIVKVKKEDGIGKIKKTPTLVDIVEE